MRAQLYLSSVLSVVIAKECKKRGAFADLERHIPALYQRQTDGPIVDAILDVVVNTPSTLQQFALDVTIRCPHSVRNTKAEATPGESAIYGEHGKIQGYGPAVSPVSIETYGRVGPASLKTITALSYALGANHRGEGSTVKQTSASLRLSVERALTYYIADTTMLALGVAATQTLWLKGEAAV